MRIKYVWVETIGDVSDVKDLTVQSEQHCVPRVGELVYINTKLRDGTMASTHGRVQSVTWWIEASPSVLVTLTP